MSISIGLYPILDLWTANKLHYITLPQNCIFFLNFVLLVRAAWQTDKFVMKGVTLTHLTKCSNHSNQQWIIQTVEMINILAAIVTVVVTGM
jgi:hypothetical protein